MSFDAVITDKNGLTVEADCRVTEPSASGLAAEISIEIPLASEEMMMLENPCSLRGSNSGLEIEIQELWYRSISVDRSGTKHTRGSFTINHAGQLWVRRSNWRSERNTVRLLLSPIRFFKEHSKAKGVDYSSTPNMTMELFKLQTTELGEVRFINFWSVKRVDTKGVTAEIRTNFAAEITYDGSFTIDQMVNKMRELLTPLSILTRQAITLHGWILEKRDGIQTMWFDPLDPNLAPDMAEQPVIDLCFAKEFEACAQAVAQQFLQADQKIKKAVTLLSISLAPHVKRSMEGNFSALFCALEEVIALKKLTHQEKKKLRETDSYLIEALLEKSNQIAATEHPHAGAVAARLEGYANSVGGSGPSFNVRFENFKAAYPGLSVYLSDLWPIQGSEKKPGLKQFRDSLAHGLGQRYSHQSIAVAHWHFSRLAERLAFLVLSANMPKGIERGASSLRRDPWYERATWEAEQISAKQFRL